ncbi:XRE family transcriptional regulator [Shinella daejeonensis]|uniref:LexA family protein n=1 Tax=Shinella daejeonensis TaxID=659017 RepID=UPI0020C7EAEB|nr:XRE family transcriptional regulator [Shinella daejeonensis]MCP8894271.1 XRE family transcriptional regulator [Shinella daejeonensis]
MKNEPRFRLQQARAKAGFNSPSEAARAFPRDINRNTLISHENGNRAISKKAAEKYGELFGVAAAWILFDTTDETGAAVPNEVSLSRVGMTAAKVAGVVEAGTFREVDEFDQSERIEVALPRDELFPNARQLLFDCSGDSMNDLKPRPILQGDRLVCLAYDDVEHLVELKSGMVVVVERTRDSGHFREWSVKQIELYPDRAEFHPRSTNPKHKPIVIRQDHDADDGVTVQVIALVRRVMNEMPGF